MTTSTLDAANTAIDAVFDSPATSNWLKSAITTLIQRDVVDAAADAEILSMLMSARLAAMLGD